jgi:hypothetical protein
MATDPLGDELNERLERGRRLAGGRWAAVGVVSEGSPINIGGVNPWYYDWESLDADVELPHPSYPNQRHRIGVFRISVDGRMILFAAGELSAGVVGFYVPTE